MPGSDERNWLKETFPKEFEDGVLCGLEVRHHVGNYPRGFHKWPLDRRNAWFAGFNVGYLVHHGPPEQEDGEAAND